MAYSGRRSTGKTPPVSQDEDSADETLSCEESIFFNEGNGHDGFLVRDGSSIVRIHPSNEHQLSDQCKFRLRVCVDYGWEMQYLPGRLLATHPGNNFVAYILKVQNIGAVRIMDLETKERCLMKVDKGVVMDVEFMHKADEVYLGFVDEFGTFYINKINKDIQTGKLSFHQIFKISLDGNAKSSAYRRFIWCKFVPDEITTSGVASIKDCAYQFAVLLDDMIYAGHLVQMVSNRDEGCYTVNEIRDDLVIIDTHSGPVTDASFAPDGTALATASKDGTVKFFQIYSCFHDKDNYPPRCLYSWEPHEGKPIDRLMFLDNHSIRPSAESQYWKFMITCTENMTEMKLFTCKTWDCLQTLHFEGGGQWKMDIDVAAQYIMATDIARKAIYLLHILHDDETARVDWIREFSVPFNILSFNLAQASKFRMQDSRSKGYSDFVTGDPDDYKPDAEMVYVQANMVVPKSLQQGMLAVDPPQTYCRSNGHHISFKPHVSYKEVAKDTETDEPTLADDEEDDDDIISPSLVSNKSATQLSNPLQLEPEESTSSGVQMLASLGSMRKNTASISPLLDTAGSQGTPSVAQMSEQLSSLIGISPGAGIVRPPSSGHGTTSSRRSNKTPSPSLQARASLEDFILPREISTSTNGNISKASSSSSPSREVEEILSPKNTEIISHRSEAAIEGILIKSGVKMDSVENGQLPLTETFRKSSGGKQKPSPLNNNDSEVNGNGVVSEKITSMIDMMSLQAAEMQDVKREVSRLSVSLKQGDDINALRKLVEAYFKDSQVRMTRMEDTIKKIDAQERLKPSPSVHTLPPNVAEVLAMNIGSIVKKEVETVVPTALERIFEPSKMNVQSQIDKMTTVLEANLTHNISQIMQQQKIWETITNNFKLVTKTVFEQTFNEIFTNTVYPRCQNAAREMFSQINEAFKTGTSQYINGLQEVLEMERKKDNTPETIRAQMNNMQDALSSALQVEVEAQMLRVVGGLQGSVVRQLEESISRELSKAFQEQKKYFEISVLPRTVTPAVSATDHYGVSPNMNDPVQMQRSLLSLAKSGEIVNAFVQACNYGDLQVLMYLCKNMPPAKVFDSKLPHQTHVSILQQMATDIQQETETKLAYLNAAIASLDTSDRKTLQSIARVLPVFQSSVAKYVAQTPESKLIMNIKILEMALVGLCNQINSPMPPSHPGSSGSQHSFSQY